MSKKLIIFVALLLYGVPVFAQSVDTAWVRRYNGEASALALDDSGNVYVTGFSEAHYLTIKYYPDGETAWVRKYDGPGPYGDLARDIDVDGSGNVYVTGYSSGWGINSDYATIKYYPNGDTAWVRRYNGPGNGDDEAFAIAVDDSGNAYVTGRSYGSGTGYDYTTIKYYPVGDTAWVRRYNGTGGQFNNMDLAWDIAVDGSGNVYVTGWSSDSVTYNDYATIKYYPNGDTAWIRRYTRGEWYSRDEARAIATDGSGNVYVTGSSDGDYLTIKYLPDGNTVWVKRYDGGWAHAISLDGSGNVYVTGGEESSIYSDYTTIKYYPNGDTAWVRRYNGPADSTDCAYGIAVDSSGSVYVAGYSRGIATDNDYAIVKYNPNGNEVWVRRYNGSGNWDDHVYDMSLSGSNVYATGGSSQNSTWPYNYDITTIVYVQFLRGDANHDGIVNVSDVVYLISYLFKGGPAPIPSTIVGDANCDGKVTVADAVSLIYYLFKGGPKPCI